MPSPFRPTGRRRLLTGTALAAVAATGLTGALAGPAAAAPAKKQASSYVFTSFGYGTRVVSALAGLESGPTSYSEIGCTRAMGLTRGNTLPTADLNGLVQVQGLTTDQRTRVSSRGDRVTRSEAKAASVTLGGGLTGIKITGLRSVTQAWVTRKGQMRASSAFTFADIVPTGTTVLPPILDLPTSTILSQLKLGAIQVPGVGSIALGRPIVKRGSTYAKASGDGLRVHLYGADGHNGGGDDSDVAVLHNFSRVVSGAPRGVISGGPWGMDAKVLGGLASVGKQPSTPIPCQGTGGRVVTQSLAGLNLLNLGALDVGVTRNRIYGTQNGPRVRRAKKSVRAWAENRVADVTVGSGAVRVSALRAYASVVRANGRTVSRSQQSIGSVTVGGRAHAVPSPGQSFEVPGVARIEVPRPVRKKAGIKVVALRITLLGGTTAGSVINLGNAELYARYR